MTFGPASTKRSPAFYAVVLVGSIVGAVLIGRSATSSGHGLSEWERQQAIEAVFDELEAESQRTYQRYPESAEYFARQGDLITEASRKLEPLANGRSSLDVFVRVYLETVDDELDQLRRSEELWGKAYEMNAFVPSDAQNEDTLRAKIEVVRGLQALAEEQLASSRRFYRLYERELRSSGFGAITASTILDEMRSDPRFAVETRMLEVGLEQMSLVLERAELLLSTWGDWSSSDEGVSFDREDAGEQYSRLVVEYEATLVELDRLIRSD